MCCRRRKHRVQLHVLYAACRACVLNDERGQLLELFYLLGRRWPPVLEDEYVLHPDRNVFVLCSSCFFRGRLECIHCLKLEHMHNYIDELGATVIKK
jgi:hypothetical protein